MDSHQMKVGSEKTGQDVEAKLIPNFADNQALHLHTFFLQRLQGSILGHGIGTGSRGAGFISVSCAFLLPRSQSLLSLRDSRRAASQCTVCRHKYVRCGKEVWRGRVKR